MPTPTIANKHELLRDPLAAFAFCYLAAHVGLDIVTESEVERVMDFVVSHHKQLVKAVRQQEAGE